MRLRALPLLGAPGAPFTATPPRLRDHLAVDHSWPLDTLPAYGKALPLRDHLAIDHSWPLDTLPAYGKALPLRVSVPAQASEPQPQHHHRLLVVECDERSLVALSVRPCAAGAASSCAVVSVACVRTSAAAEAGPRFTLYKLWGLGEVAARRP
jgi:hypothetical protein